MSINATLTPFPVENCHALLTLSIAKPGDGNAASDADVNVVVAQRLLCRIGCSGPGGPSVGTSVGSTTGRGRADALGITAVGATTSITAVTATARTPPPGLIASEPNQTVHPPRRQAEARRRWRPTRAIRSPFEPAA